MALVFSFSLIVLIFIYTNRYTELNTNKADGTTFVYIKDEWTNQVWVNIYRGTYYDFTIPSYTPTGWPDEEINKEKLKEKNRYTNYWYIAVMANIILLFSTFFTFFRKRKPRNINKS